MVKHAGFALLFVLLASGLAATKAAPQTARPAAARTQPAPARCPVTLPDSTPELGKRTPEREAMSYFEPGTSRWKPILSVGLWPDGTVMFTPGGPGSIEPDGSLAMKFAWTRGEGLRGKLKIHGRRLDASAPPLRASIPDGYGDTGFQATALIFPTAGCWEVTGEVGDVHTTFVTRVVQIKESK